MGFKEVLILIKSKKANEIQKEFKKKFGESAIFLASLARTLDN